MKEHQTLSNHLIKFICDVSTIKNGSWFCPTDDCLTVFTRLRQLDKLPVDFYHVTGTAVEVLNVTFTPAVLTVSCEDNTVCFRELTVNYQIASRWYQVIFEQVVFYQFTPVVLDYHIARVVTANSWLSQLLPSDLLLAKKTDFTGFLSSFQTAALTVKTPGWSLSELELVPDDYLGVIFIPQITFKHLKSDVSFQVSETAEVGGFLYLNSRFSFLSPTKVHQLLTNNLAVHELDNTWINILGLAELFNFPYVGEELVLTQKLAWAFMLDASSTAVVQARNYRVDIARNGLNLQQLRIYPFCFEKNIQELLYEKDYFIHVPGSIITKIWSRSTNILSENYRLRQLDYSTLITHLIHQSNQQFQPLIKQMLFVSCDNLRFDGNKPTILDYDVRVDEFNYRLIIQVKAVRNLFIKGALVQYHSVNQQFVFDLPLIDFSHEQEVDFYLGDLHQNIDASVAMAMIAANQGWFIHKSIIDQHQIFMIQPMIVNLQADDWLGVVRVHYAFDFCYGNKKLTVKKMKWDYCGFNHHLSSFLTTLICTDYGLAKLLLTAAFTQLGYKKV